MAQAVTRKPWAETHVLEGEYRGPAQDSWQMTSIRVMYSTGPAGLLGVRTRYRWGPIRLPFTHRKQRWSRRA